MERRILCKAMEVYIKGTDRTMSVGKCHFRQFGLVAVHTKRDWRSEHDRLQHGDLSHGK